MIVYRPFKNKEEAFEFFSKPENHWIKWVENDHNSDIDKTIMNHYYTPTVLTDNGFFIEDLSKGHDPGGRIYITYYGAADSFISAKTGKFLLFEEEV